MKLAEKLKLKSNRNKSRLKTNKIYIKRLRQRTISKRATLLIKCPFINLDTLFADR